MKGLLKSLAILALCLFAAIILVLLGWSLRPSQWSLLKRDAWNSAVGLVVGAGMAFFGSALALRGIYGRSFLGTLFEHIRVVLRLDGTPLVIENGEITEPSGKSGRLLGPRSVLIKGSVVTFAQGARQTRVEGPGTVRTQPGEYVQSVYDLRPKQETLELERVLTSDQLPMRLELSLTYAIDLPEDVVRSGRKLTEGERQMLLRMDHESPDMHKTVRAVVEQVARREVGSLEYRPLLGPDSMSRLDHAIIMRANRMLAARVCGARLHNVTVTKLLPADELVAASSQAEAEATLGKSRAEAVRDALKLVRDEYKSATSKDVPETFIQQLLTGITSAPPSKAAEKKEGGAPSTPSKEGAGRTSV